MKKLKKHIFDFEKIHRTFFFLSKLRSELKTKILDTSQILQIREKILKIAIMQKKNLKRTRDNDNNSNSNSNPNSNCEQFKFKNFKSFKSQHQQQFRQNFNYQNKQNKQQSNCSNNKRNYNVVNSNSNLKNVKCYYCHKKNHYINNCSYRYIAIAVNNIIESKKKSILSTRRRKNQKNQ